MRWTLRQQHEWKISLGLWAAMLVAAYSVKTRPSEIFLIISLLAILIMHTIITNQLVMKSRQDMDTAFFYIEHAEKLLFNLQICQESVLAGLIR
jgi:uncharacterized protein YhhL (DUF1145 family)